MLPATHASWCGGLPTPGAEVYYRFDSPLHGDVLVTLEPEDADLDLAVLASLDTGGCDAAGACLAWSQQAGVVAETASIGVEQGHTYYVVIDGASDVSSGYRLSLACSK
jgi:hypothetical protein